MFKFELAETEKYSKKILLRWKNLRFLRCTNHNKNSLENGIDIRYIQELLIHSSSKTTKFTCT